MLEIKTITKNNVTAFDKAVNEAMVAGWDLIRRECFITGSDRATTFYAELERIVEGPVAEEEDVYVVARWEVTRNPLKPYVCNNCAYKTNAQWPTCPGCGSVMENAPGGKQMKGGSK